MVIWLPIYLLMVITIASCNYTLTLRDSSLALKTTPDLPDTLCPTWFTRAHINDSVWCECNTDSVQRGLLRCPSKNKICVQNCKHQEHYSTDTLNVSILTSFCMTHNFETRQTLLAFCSYNTHVTNSSDFFITLPSNISELNDFMCGHIRREGDLCNHCINNTGPSLASSRLGCYDVSRSGKEWLFFLVLQVMPPVTFFFIILFCKVRATAGPLNGFVFFCQITSCFIAQRTSPVESAIGLHASNQWNSTSHGVVITII